MESCVLVRYGEVAIKSARKRPFFEKYFLNAIRRSLESHAVSFDRIENLGKMFAVFSQDTDSVCRALELLAGVESYSVASRFVMTDYTSLLNAVVSIASDWVSDRKFRVTVKRSGNQSFSSMQLAKDVGSRLEPVSSGVDLSHPEVTVFVVVRDSNCYVFSEYTSGLGGLPPGTVGRSLMLFSGGIDSPVAAFEMLKRGCSLDFLFVNMVGDTMFADVSKVYDFLISRYAFNHKPRFIHIDGRSLMRFLKKEVPERLRQLAFKISLYLISERVAEKHGLSSFVTGESLSQKSTQTLASLDFIQHSGSLMVLRPLLTHDKNDIITLARRIGTFAASERVKEQCNITDGPVTAVPAAEDRDLIPDLSGIVEECVDSLQVYSGTLDCDTLSYLPSSDIDRDAVTLVDIRSSSVCAKDPLDADIAISYPDILDNLDRFSDKKRYVVVCSQGVLSYELAHVLTGRGISATAVSVKEYRKLVRDDDAV